MSEKPVGAGNSSYDMIDTTIFWETLGLADRTVLMDLGCGIGNYAVAAADRIGPQGLVYAIDLWQEGIEQLEERIAKKNIKNIQTAVADISRKIPVDTGTVDVCLMATVVHDLIKANSFSGTMTGVNRVLNSRGRLVVVEFKKTVGPPGPPIHIRLSPEELFRVMQPFGFTKPQVIDVGKHHYLAQFDRIS